MRIKLVKDLEPIRAGAISQINSQAEIVRGTYITLGSGQAMVYAEKEKQAETVVANPDTSANLARLVAVDAEENGISMFDAAVIILTKAEEWRVLAPIIERKRNKAIAAVATATTPAAIHEATLVDWTIET